MRVASDTVVLFHYQLSDETGETLENSRDGDPVACLIGHGNVIRGLETALIDRESGDIFSVSVPPEQGYGLRNENAKQRIPIKHLVENTQSKKGKFRPGMVASVQTDHGIRQVVIEKVGKFNVDVDTNHPLAGKNLQFDVEIVEVRDATPEEVDHGHAHGVGGHHH
ncbi:MAG: FKBP-type peptidyl-prolyl cis-trans isomerase [bacterium]